MEGYIIANDYENELCIWHEKELCEALLEQEFEARKEAMFAQTWED